MVTVQFIRRGDVMDGPNVKVVREERMDVVPRVGDHLVFHAQKNPDKTGILGEVHSVWWRSHNRVHVAFE